MAATAAENWPGAVAVYSSLDGQSWTYETVLSQRAVMGRTENELVVATPGLWQRGQQVRLKLVHGALQSLDELSLLAGGNIAAIGDGSGRWELLQFRNAELLAPDTWGLGHLLRGQQGTEADMPGVWPAGSTVVVFNTALAQLAVPSGLRGVNRQYRVGPASQPVDHVSYVDLNHAASAVGLRPYAPVHLRATRDEAGAHVVRWIRRTRIDGDSWALADVPLGETYEAYAVTIRSSGAVIREETVTEPVFSYGAADQLADGITEPFEMEIAQISDRYGPGAPARIMING